MRTVALLPQRMLVVSLFASVAIGACGQQGPREETNACAVLKSKMQACFQEDVSSARCDESKLSRTADLQDMSCEQLSQVAKADEASLSGCAPGEHACALLFCCPNDHYPLTWTAAAEEHYDIVPLIKGFQSRIPEDIAERVLQGSLDNLLFATVSETYYDDVEGHDMIVEVTRGVINRPYAEVAAQLPIQNWGIRLADYLGGEVNVVATDEQGQATRQLERMVLSTIQSDLGLDKPLDMTKVEVIERDVQSATVYWKVMHSDNGTVIADVGSLTFARYDDTRTEVTFFSAHKLSGYMPKFAVALYLSYYFDKAIRNYAAQLLY